MALKTANTWPKKSFAAPAGLKPLRAKRNAAAFSLIEALIASGVAVLMVGACMTAIFIDQVCIRKAKEQALAMNFLTKYAENIKALPFTSVAPNLPINVLYNGVGGAPLIAIPPDTNWVSLNTTNYQMFFPDLLWITNRNPQLRVAVTQNNVSGTLHDIEINARVDWNSPLGRGARLEVQVDFTRYVSVPTL